ncbi:hypothetical protein AYI69_g183 [Smittium culicis]|uniref:Uncharacterized protein n=1 Tax=Smittium culicis TaxID=133412 RepID=A0A1R1YTT7_9FUNG|nr:hypothetical protein AYI69_g183 [Smittium culicis]
MSRKLRSTARSLIAFGLTSPPTDVTDTFIISFGSGIEYKEMNGSISLTKLSMAASTLPSSRKYPSDKPASLEPASLPSSSSSSSDKDISPIHSTKSISSDE